MIHSQLLALPHFTFPGNTTHPIIFLISLLFLTPIQLQMPVSPNKNCAMYYEQFRSPQTVLVISGRQQKRLAINHCLLSALKKWQLLINVFPLQARY